MPHIAFTQALLLAFAFAMIAAALAMLLGNADRNAARMGPRRAYQAALINAVCVGFAVFLGALGLWYAFAGGAQNLVTNMFGA